MNRLIPALATGALATALAFAGTVALAGPAAADDTTCTGSIGAVSLDGNVIVPSGRTCRLTGTTVDGNVEVDSGATLIVRSASIGGSIQSQGHRRVDVGTSAVDGSIQLEQGGTLSLVRNTVGSDIQLFSNRTGTKTVSSNRVDGNLQCKSNSPAPTGGRNVVQGNKEGQCRAL